MKRLHLLSLTFLTLSMPAAFAQIPQAKDAAHAPAAATTPQSAATTMPPAPANAPQWVRSDNVFPPAPAQSAPNTAATSAAPTKQTTLGPSAYAAGATAAGKPNVPSTQNGMAPLPPLAPPSNLQQAESVVSPFSKTDIVRLRKQLDQTRQAKAYRPVRTVPRISSISVDLSPGAALPIARMLPGEMSTLLFIDASGAPWPLAAAPRVSDNRNFDAEWLQGTATVIISALSPYEEGNLTVILQGFSTPILVKLVTGEPDSKEKSRVVDYRLDLRIPARGPGAQAPVPGIAKIALYDDTMQQFLDGLPPKEAKLIKMRGEAPGRTKVWQLNGSLFLRTVYDMQTAFDQSIASGDGMHVYRLSPTPYVTLSDLGQSIICQLDID
jgi:intracellular multiplication protein IcmK